MAFGAPCWTPTLALMGVMAVAAFLDYRYRDVEPALWLASGIPLAPLGAYCVVAVGVVSVWVVVIGNAIVVGLAAALYLAGLLGGGDVAALLLIAVALPAWERSLLPPSMLALLYGSLLAVLSIPYTCMANVMDREARRSLREIARDRGMLTALLTCASSRYLTIEESLRRGWLYPSKVEAGSYSIIERDPPELLAPLAAERGLQGRVWVTPGNPQLVFIAVGLILAIVVGDAPLVKVGRLIGAVL